MNKSKTEQLLFAVGLARKAGKMTVGTEMVCDEVRKKKAFVVLYASDISANTEKRITDCCRFYETPCFQCEATKDILGAAIGKSFAACIAVTDENLAKLIRCNL